MDNQKLNNLQTAIEKKYCRRDKKKKRTMKVSGAGVKRLQKIIKEKK